MFKISHHLIKRFDHFWHTLVNPLESISQRWAKRNQKRKAQLPQPPQLRKLRCALIFYFETLRKLRCGLKSLKFVAL